jgi:hypothetical protein
MLGWRFTDFADCILEILQHLELRHGEHLVTPRLIMLDGVRRFCQAGLWRSRFWQPVLSRKAPGFVAAQ